MNLRIVELYVIYEGILDNGCIRKLVYTNAPDEIIQNVCADIKNDKQISRADLIGAIMGVLQIRGYECRAVDHIPSFGIKED